MRSLARKGDLGRARKFEEKIQTRPNGQTWKTMEGKGGDMESETVTKADS